MSVVIKHYCDWPGCGKEFVKHAAPWEPDYCPEHMAKYRERQKNFNTYVTKPDPDIRVWLSDGTDGSSIGSIRVGGSSLCKRCHVVHPPGPCENFNTYYPQGPYPK